MGSLATIIVLLIYKSSIEGEGGKISKVDGSEYASFRVWLRFRPPILLGYLSLGPVNFRSFRFASRTLV